MSQPRSPVPSALRAWGEALATAVAGTATMLVVAALGLWAAGAGDLPGGGFPQVAAAVVVMAVGGSVDLTGGAGFLARTDAAIDVIPLSVTLAGSLVTAVVFLLPLRTRAVTDVGELLGRVARTAVLWLLLLLLLALAARHSFSIPVGDGIEQDLGEALGATPQVGFRADVPPTLGFGLLWVLAVLALAFLVSRKAPLPSRLLHFQNSVRPPAFAMLLVLLGYVVIGLVAGVVTLITRGHPAETVAVLLLGLPNLVWIALGLGMGGTWEGHVDQAIGLPMPHVLDQVLRSKGVDRTLDMSSLAQYDGRAWLLVAVAAVALLGAAFVAAVRSPVRTPAWRHAVDMAVASAVALLLVGLTTRISARYGLSLIGIGDLGGGLGGEVSLEPHLFLLVVLAALWGLATGFLGSLLARHVRHLPGDVKDAEPGSPSRGGGP
ncbi:streptophobe family protein [Streptomyces sp. RKAG337]|uniref:streptophobe family protein n=1 Tax=Streptomyces sp. RKAG337 TaxID=2893404 RepID=UPI002033B8D0|nr:streptophobe family protein [Streptomyces sp. RKAG337]MCM2426430.1 streptophobe family protein [Streptomyces sp. RKAG337]